MRAFFLAGGRWIDAAARISSSSAGARRHFADRGYLRKDYSDRNYRKKGFVDPGNFSYTVPQDSRKVWKPPQFAGERYEHRSHDRESRYSSWSAKDDEEESNYPFTGSKLDKYPSSSRAYAGFDSSESQLVPAANSSTPPKKKDEESEDEDSELVVRDRFQIRKTLSDDADSSLQTFHRPDCRLFEISGNMDEDWQPAPSDECLVFEMRSLFKQGNVATWEAEDVVRSFGGQLRPFHVFEVLKSCTPSEAGIALAFFRWAGLQPFFQHVSATYNMMLKLLQEAGKYLDMARLAKEMENDDIPRTVETSKILLVSLFKGGYVEDALEVFSQMERSSSPPGFNEYKYVIDRMLRSECYLVVPVLYKGLMTAGHAPDSYVYNAVISSLCNVANMDEAMKVFSKMKDKSTIDLFTYTILIDGYIKCHNVTGATRLFLEMLERGCLPGEEIFNLLFGLHAKAGELDEAVNLFRKIAENGCQPTVKSYGMLLDTFAMVNNLEGAHAFYMELIGKNIYPSSVSCNSLLSRLSKAGKTTLALTFFREMKSFPGTKPNGITYNIAIDLFGKTAKFAEAWEEFLDMKRNGCSPSVVTYNTLIVRLGRGGYIELCFDLYEEMRERGITANQFTYCGLIDVLTRYNQVEHALEFLDEMKRLHFHPSFNTLQLVIKSLWKTGDLAAAKQLCQDYPGVYTPQLESSRAPPSDTSTAVATHSGGWQRSDYNNTFSSQMELDPAMQLDRYMEQW
ncbi:pentatricopeptide repeat-containing protein At3g22470, mitochondrial [Selaginella moellendorffii]|nr:pentatricopeptide repeat-containing protein At3g22470, mitochondrial [Selaginella moellendorffii]XP_024517965.1 pentatricopeptide repeat-containing protein At3g22470, mitochondrial [Selaginella moellendorffii]|eukprot:XP_002963135.2 pentatricopeptide repeat-containing protein At3g22470, mitochondrial [Selaginella moellendorffii]